MTVLGLYPEIFWGHHFLKSGPILDIGSMSAFFGAHFMKKGHFFFACTP